jgi:hypothetical protein
MDGHGSKMIYWHNELPPFGAEAIGEHIVETASGRVPGTLAHRDELWTQCYEDLMAQVRTRLSQEMIRLGGDYAHVLSERAWTASTTRPPAKRGYTVASRTCSIARPHATKQITTPKRSLPPRENKS